MAKTLLFIGFGGGVGSIARYLISMYVQKTFPAVFPFGTFAINLLGCLLIGLFFGLSERFQWMTEEWRIFLTVGFCGGFTTFSAFAYENLKLLQSGDYLNFLLYSIGSIIIGIMMVMAGFYMVKSI